MMTASQLRHVSMRNALYHLARRRWLETWGKLFNFFIVVAGSSAAADIFGYFPESRIWLPLGIAAIGALQLVYDFSGQARTHEILQRRYYSLLAEIDECVAPTKIQCAKWLAEISRMAGDEPPTLRALDAIADNQATSTIYGGGSRLRVTWWQSLTRQILAHNGATFQAHEDWKLPEQPLPEVENINRKQADVKKAD
jgi:hypothetical protein